MKIVIYRKTNREFYQLKYNEPKEEVRESFEKTLKTDDFEINELERNSNFRLFSTLNGLDKEKYKIEQLKLIVFIKEIDTYLYMVKIDEIETKESYSKDGSSLNKFEDFFVIIDDEKQKAIYNKKIDKYYKSLEKSKKYVSKQGWKNEQSATNSKNAIFEAIITICLGLFAFLKELLNSFLKSYSSKIQVGIAGVIIAIALIVFVIGVIKVILLFNSKKNSFKEKTKSIYFSDGEEQKDIDSQIEENLTKKYTDFKTLFKDQSDKPELFLYSGYVNQNLEKNAKELEVKLIKNKQKLSKFSREALACIVNSKLEEDKIIFNGELLGLSSDLNFSKNSKINVKKVNYFNYIANDEMIYKNIASLDDPSYFIKGTSMSLNPVTKGFKDMECSPLTNVIGVNLIVIVHCQDKEYVIINQQSLTNDVNRNRYVPSASGSSKYSDYNNCKKINDSINFEELLKYGMYRELKEESYLDEDFINKHKPNYSLLGVARLYTKSGKPDFFGKLELYVESLDEILSLFDCEQEKMLRKKEEIKAYKSKDEEIDIETNVMIIVSKDAFVNSMSDSNMSPQLKYIRHLLKNQN